MVRLTGRERLLAAGMVLVVAVWAVYVAAVQPVRERIRTLERVIPEKRSELETLRLKSAEYVKRRQAVEDLRARIEAQDSSFELPSYLETLVEKQGLTPHIVTMAPNTLQLQADYAETIVGIELEDVSLRQIIDLLGAVETAGVFAEVGSLHIYRSPTGGDTLNATVEIHSPQLSSNVVALDSYRRS